MALVSYDYESGSSSDNEDKEPDAAVTVKEKAIDSEIIPASPKQVSDKVDTTDTSLFSSLPQTKTVTNVIHEDQIEDFIPKSKPVKVKQKVKITIPSLSDFNDVEDDEPQIKKQKTANKSSGLISLLPPVRGSVMTAKSFVPNILNQKKNASASKPNALVPNAVRKRAEAKQAALMKRVTKQAGSDIESDDDVDVPETFDDEMWEKVCGRPKPKQKIQEPDTFDTPQEAIDIAPEPEKPYDGLDNQAFKELVGKTKRPLGNIKLIDINEEEILPEKDIWLAKSLTDPDVVPKAKIEDPVDPTKRKKHHITYLAQQAKANEQELQSAWAASKNNRMMSRAKYGF